MSAARGRPSALWYLLPVLLLAATALGEMLLLRDPLSVFDPVLRAKTVRLPGEVEVELEEAGRYSIYRDRSVSWEVPLEFRVTRAEGGPPLRLEPIVARTTLSLGAGDFLGVSTFEVDAPGTVRVKASYADGAEGKPQTVAIAPALEIRGIFEGVLTWIAAAFLALIGLAGAGTVFVVVLLKRGSRRALLPPPPPAAPSA